MIVHVRTSLAAVLVLAATLSACGPTADTTTGAVPDTAGAVSVGADKTIGTVSEGDEAADVVAGECVSEVDGIGVMPVTVENHSSKRSDYILEVSFFDKDGVKIGDGTNVISNVDPGGKAKDEVTGFIKGTIASCTIAKVDRTASV